jgi:hypothetical protein
VLCQLPSRREHAQTVSTLRAARASAARTAAQGEGSTPALLVRWTRVGAVAWDVFLVLGAVLLAWNMHPRFGRVLAVSGCVIAMALIVINLAVFPEPPGHNAIDLGPAIGLWYLIVTIRLAMSGRWAAEHELSA